MIVLLYRRWKTFTRASVVEAWWQETQHSLWQQQSLEQLTVYKSTKALHRGLTSWRCQCADETRLRLAVVKVSQRLIHRVLHAGMACWQQLVRDQSRYRCLVERLAPRLTRLHRYLVTYPLNICGLVISIQCHVHCLWQVCYNTSKHLLLSL